MKIKVFFNLDKIILEIKDSKGLERYWDVLYGCMIQSDQSNFISFYDDCDILSSLK